MSDSAPYDDRAPPGLKPGRAMFYEACGGDPRIICLRCKKCERRWLILIPEQDPKGFLWGLKCECGADPDDTLMIRSGVDTVRRIIHDHVR